jgi:proteic killer suppression protein
VIKSFSHKGLEDFFYDGTKKGIQPKHAGKLEEILDRLNQAREIRDMDYRAQIFILYCARGPMGGQGFW